KTRYSVPFNGVRPHYFQKHATQFLLMGYVPIIFTRPHYFHVPIIFMTAPRQVMREVPHRSKYSAAPA
ncbi:hypothetical protein, partial [uncultured Neptuniibacter sp.]|uniref:hypothetical protein n=1 Tax=uncultured Neptuniibacter sp. TaxID=502143 RepID=UPI0032B30053